MTEFLAALVLFYLWHAMGITVGYHRLLSHRSFKCNKLFEYFWVLGGYFAYQGSPIWWSAIHRAHHKYADTPLDPHSPRQGIGHALYGWLLVGRYPDHIDPNTQCADLVKDPIYRFLEVGGKPPQASLMNLVINILFRSALWLLFGWHVALASLVASLLVFNVPQLLNVVCHIPSLGYKNFATKDDGVNVWWVALLAVGEGWHNNHHAYPGSAQTGIRAHELDLSWWTILLGQKLRLVSVVNVPAGMARKARMRKGAIARLNRIAATKRKRMRVA